MKRIGDGGDPMSATALVQDRPPGGEGPSAGARGRERGRRRICIVTETYPPEINGVALTLARLAGGLRARGHAVSVVRPRQATDARSGGDRGRDGEVTLVRGFALPGYKEVRVGLPACAQLRACWSGRRPDAVYVATEGPLGWSAVRAANQLGVPVWSGFHTNFADYARHYGLGWLAPVVLQYLRRLHNQTRGTLVASAEMRDRLRGLGFNDVSVLGRGVDSELFSPGRRSAALRAAWGARDEDTVALYVGRLAPEKNVPLAAEAYRAMRRAQGAARLVIVGDGPLRGELEQAHPDLIFCGMRTGEQLAEHYASADVFLFPSETETFGNVTLEAMASGLVVLAYDYAAAHIHIADGESGVLVPRGDSRGFVEAAAVLARQPARLAEMGRRARAHAASIDWPSVVKPFEALLIGASVEPAVGALARAAVAAP
jgi:glycosyltransferase involved in cell wall biosynthesis